MEHLPKRKETIGEHLKKRKKKGTFHRKNLPSFAGNCEKKKTRRREQLPGRISHFVE